MSKGLYLFVWCSLISCSPAPSPAIHYLIGVSQANLSEPWRISVTEDIKRQASIYDDVRVIVTNASDTLGKQIGDIETLEAWGVDLLIISPIDSVAITPYVTEAYKSIPVIVLDRAVVNYDYTLYIGPDNAVIGRAAGRYVASTLGTKGGSVMEILGRSGSPPSVERDEGFRQEISGNKRIVMQTPVIADWLRDKAEDLAYERWSTGRVPRIVFAHNDAMAYGAWLAADRLGLASKIRFLGVDGLPGPRGGLELLRYGQLDATFAAPTGGVAAVDYAMQILAHRTDLPKKVFLNATIVTAQTLGKESPSSHTRIGAGPLRIAFVPRPFDTEWDEALTKSLLTSVKKAGFKVSVYPPVRGVTQQKAVSRALQQGMDALVLTPTSEKGWEEILGKVKEAGIPVFLYGSEIDPEDYDLWTTFLGRDDQEAGRRVGRWLAAEGEDHRANLGGFRILEIGGPQGFSPSDEVADGFARGVTDFPGGRIVHMESVEGTREDGRLVLRNALASHFSFNVVFSHSAEAALGALDVLRLRPRTKAQLPLVVTVNDSPEVDKKRKQGTIAASVKYSPSLGPLLVKVIADYFSGRDVPRRILVADSLLDDSGHN